MDMKMQFATPRLPVSNIDVSCDFYVENLNFTIVHKNHDYAILQSDKVELHLFKWTPVNGVEQLIANSCRIKVKKIEKLYEYLETKEIIHPNGTLTKQVWGEIDFTVVDIDNNAINFYQPIN